MKNNNIPKILIDSSSPEERRGFLKKLGAFAASMAALGGFTNLKAKNTFSGKELSAAVSTDPYLGSIAIFAGSFAIRGWSFCDGQTLAISSNEALFSLLGTTFGGDGRTSFGIPDLRGRVPMSPTRGAPGMPTYRWGQMVGSTTHILTTSQLPAHNHTAEITEAPAYTGSVKPKALNGRGSRVEDPAGRYSASRSGVAKFAEANDVEMGESPVTIATSKQAPPYGRITVGNTGSSQAFSIMQPSIAVNFMISMVGVYPSRN